MKRYISFGMILLFLSCTSSTNVEFQSEKAPAKKSYLNEVENSIRNVVDKVSPSTIYMEIIVQRKDDKKATIYVNGCFIDEKGHIITIPMTQKQVIEINVWYKTKKYEAYLIKNYPTLGYSVIRFIPPNKTKPIVFGDTSLLERGSFIYGVGATSETLSFEPIVNFGMIGAIISQRVDVIIHNGFPLYSRKDLSTLGMPITNNNGEVIGFASHNLIVTNDDAKVVAKNFFERDNEKDNDERAWIGILLEVVSEDESDALNIPRSGLKITRVYYDSPAEDAGIKYGDILIGVNDQFFTKKNDGVFSQFRKWNNSKLNQATKFHLLRQGKKNDITVTYNEIPKADVTKISELGISIQKIRNIDYYDYGLPVRYGVLINKVGVDGIATSTYFNKDAVNRGDIIVEFDGVPIYSITDFHSELSKAKSAKKELVLLKVLSGHFANYTVIKPKYQ